MCRNCWASECWRRNFLVSELLDVGTLGVGTIWCRNSLVSELLESETSGVGTLGVWTSGVGTLGVWTSGVGTLEVVGTVACSWFSRRPGGGRNCGRSWFSFRPGGGRELRCSWFSLRPGGGRNCGAPGFLFDLEVVGTAVLLVFSSTWRWSELRCLTRRNLLKTLQIVTGLCVEGMWWDRRRSAAVDVIAEGQRLNFGIGVVSLLRNDGSNFNSSVRQMGNFSTEFSECRYSSGAMLLGGLIFT